LNRRNLANAGENAATMFPEFFAARIRNQNTREAYARAFAQFLSWSENHVDDIRAITPMHVAAHIKKHPGSPAADSLANPSNAAELPTCNHS
jgi:hypothetical protein